MITVAICTFNRSVLLEQTLSSLEGLDEPDDLLWELVVVDNNSSDETGEVLKRFAERLPLRSLFEPRAGKSHAANLAVREARGEWIVWTDDDVLIDPGWLTAYADALARHPKAGIFGGPIEPWFEGEPPSWLERAFPEISNAYAALDLGPEEVPLGHDTYPYGANMALRRDLHLREPFDTAIGPNPETKLRGEEMVLVRRLLSSGERGVWIPAARVRHFIPEERQTVRYLRDYFYSAGRVLDYLQGSSGRRLFGKPLWLLREAAEFELKYRLLRPFVDPPRWTGYLRRASVARGRLRGYEG